MIEVKTKSTIKTKEFAFDLKDDSKRTMFVESFNYVPFLALSKLNDPSINGTTIDPKDVIYVKLHNSKFLPEIELYCYDSKGIFFSDLYPLDHDTLLSIFVKSNSENLMPIRMDFRITEFETTRSQENTYTLKYLIKGILDVDSLHYTRYEARKGTSYEILKKLSEELDLGFATNVDNSDDEMIWINPSETYIKYIQDITEHSFIDDKSFIWTFIDFNYNLNYVNINKEMNEFNKNEESTQTNSATVKRDEESTVNFYLTNKPAFNTTNRYIAKFNIVNQSYKINLEKNYRFKATWFDKKENKGYRQFLNDIESDGKPIKPLYDYESKIYNENINDEFFIGKMDTDNVHKNYGLAKVINQFNLENIGKMKMIVTLNQTNFDIKRFQNLKIEIYNINDMLSQNAEKKPATENINEKLSGFWLVTGINYLYRRTGGVEQEITLMRRDLSINYGGGSDSKTDLRKLDNFTQPNIEPNFENKDQIQNNTQSINKYQEIKKIEEKIQNVTNTWNKEGEQRKSYEAELKRLKDEKQKLINSV